MEHINLPAGPGRAPYSAGFPASHIASGKYRPPPPTHAVNVAEQSLSSGTTPTNSPLNAKNPNLNSPK